MSRDELVKQAKRHMERWAPAKSCINEAEAFFEEHGPALGEVAHAGLWCGPRRTKKEAFKLDVYREALQAAVEYMSLEAFMDKLFDPANQLITESIMKALLWDKDFGQLIKNALDDDPDGGIKESFGEWNFGPVGKRPDEDKNDLDYADYLAQQVGDDGTEYDWGDSEGLSPG